MDTREAYTAVGAASSPYDMASHSALCLQHIKEQYQGLKPILDALVAAYPAHLEAAWFSWDAYLWAVQLWYAYAMKVSIQAPAASIGRCSL
jgi:hypothetical protein